MNVLFLLIISFNFSNTVNIYSCFFWPFSIFLTCFLRDFYTSLEIMFFDIFRLTILFLFFFLALVLINFFMFFFFSLSIFFLLIFLFFVKEFNDFSFKGNYKDFWPSPVLNCLHIYNLYRVYYAVSYNVFP